VSRENETPKERHDRELIELLNELRVALPGVQVLFAFLLTVPFSNGWRRITEFQKDIYIASFLCAAVSSTLLIAPSIYHRIRWRARDKERLLRTANREAIAGMAFLALGMTGSVFLIADVVFGLGFAGAIAGVAAGAFAWLWFGLPLLRRAQAGP